MPIRKFLVSVVIIGSLFSMDSPAVAQSASKSNTHAVNQPQASEDQNDLAALKTDVAKMRVIVTQMQNNLGLTTNSTTPLYHQFELDINMWQLLIAQTERRVKHMENKRSEGGK
jgi:hypothetical protein